jgi:hypothetical protein
MTEHSEQGIRNIEFGNSALDVWLRDEKLFIEKINTSTPYRFCLKSVYYTLVRLGELPLFWKFKGDNELIDNARRMAVSCWNENETTSVDEITMCLLVVNTIAEKRLSITTGI